jgi:hypothetical protein
VAFPQDEVGEPLQPSLNLSGFTLELALVLLPAGRRRLGLGPDPREEILVEPGECLDLG